MDFTRKPRIFGISEKESENVKKKTFKLQALMSRYLENWRVIIEEDKGESLSKWTRLSSVVVYYALKLEILEMSLSRLITFFADRG